MELEGSKDLGDKGRGNCDQNILNEKLFSIKKKQLLSSHHYICNLETKRKREGETERRWRNRKK